MKHIFSRSRTRRWDSFTLVELLVVIGIIAILAGVLLGAAGYAIRAAQRAKAFNLANQIQSSALNFYTEYSVYPIPPSATANADYELSDVSGSAATWGAIICSLSGNLQPSTGTAWTVNGSTPTNARGIAFLSLKSSDVDSNNAPKNPLPTGSEIYYNIAMDGNYDGVMGSSTTAGNVQLPNFAASPFTGSALTSGGTATTGVAVWANCNGNSNTTNAQFYVRTY
jgi:prepilin-type N-terminal cleavage/methylation domain-containing protein